MNLNFENIDEDFDIYCLKKPGNKNDLLSLITYDSDKFKALSVQWSYSNKCLMLFKKDKLDEEEFREYLSDNFKDAEIIKIDPLDEDQRKEHFKKNNYLLGQLLFNSLKTPKNENFTYSNHTGMLLYHQPKWKKVIRDKNKRTQMYIYYLQIVLTSDLLLHCDVCTFKKCSGKDLGNFVIDYNTGEFRKRLKTDTDGDTYIKKGIQDKKCEVTFIDISNYEAFKNSKLGVTERFITDARDNLSKYLSIDIVSREDTKIFDPSQIDYKSKTNLQLGDILNKKGVTIVNEIDDEIFIDASNELIANIQKDLLKYYGVKAKKAKKGKLSANSYNIRLIHEQSYYEGNELSDPHDDDLSNYIVQHIQLEQKHEFSDEKCSQSIKKIVQELCIKEDIFYNKITVFDWGKFADNRQWTFVSRESLKDANEQASDKGDGTNDNKKQKHQNYAGRWVSSYYEYGRLQINADGTMQYDNFCDNSESSPEDWAKICYAYDYMAGKEYEATVEGIIYNDIDNMHYIVATKEFIIPNIFNLMDVLKKTDDKLLIKSEVVKRALSEFLRQNPEYSDAVTEWQSKLNLKESFIVKGDIRKAAKINSNAGKAFNEFLSLNENILLSGEVRSAKNDDLYSMKGFADIRYCENIDDNVRYNAVGGKSYSYYVGDKSKSIKSSYPRACKIRKVIIGIDDKNIDNNINIEELLSLMAVDFVRNEQYTVTPFPFKYLREYRRKK